MARIVRSNVSLPWLVKQEEKRKSLHKFLAIIIACYAYVLLCLGHRGVPRPNEHKKRSSLLNFLANLLTINL